VLYNQGLMPAGPPASEPQMADAESLHNVGCGRNACFVTIGLDVWGTVCVCVWAGGASCAVQPGADASWAACEPQMADAEIFHKVNRASTTCDSCSQLEAELSTVDST
jgi:hypothetical protein